VGLVAAGLALNARAGIPAAYEAMVVEPRVTAAAGSGGAAWAAGSGSGAGAAPASIWEFDLRPAQQRARREGRRLYIYLGATDCPYCRRYEAFLAAHAAELAPQFKAQRYLVVDLRSQLSVQARQLWLRSEQVHGAYADFQRALGDQRERLLVYPSVWLLDAASGRPLMQMPAGTGTFQTVAEQLEILRLEQ
jgi:hypothetical protein